MYTSQKLTVRAKIGGGLLWRTIALFALLSALLVSLPLTAKAQSTAPSQLIITINSQGMTPASATLSAVPQPSPGTLP